MTFSSYPDPLGAATEAGRLKVTSQFDADALGSFGDLITADLTPVLHLTFVHGINSQTGTGTTASGGTADTNASRLRLQTGTNIAGSAYFQSRRPAAYRPGEGMVARFTCAFTTGVASSSQIVGVGNLVDGYFFGFNGTSFGILHRNNSVDTWVAQTDWNGDKCNGSGASKFDWNKTYGTVCQIKYPYLGYGNITFWVQDPNTSRWILCHTIKYNNTTATVQLTNPRLFFFARVLNSGNNTNLILYVGSVGAFVSGMRSFIASPRWAADNNKSGITAETNILSLRNCATYNGAANRSLIRLTQVSFGSRAATGLSVLRFRIGATVGGVPAFACVNGTTADNGVTITSGNSITSVDTAGTTATGGTYIFNLSASNASGSEFIDLTPYELFVAPGETLTASIFSTISTEASVSLNWNEDI